MEADKRIVVCVAAEVTVPGFQTWHCAIIQGISLEDATMYAVVFRTKIKNGTIGIPEEYRHRLREQVRVIVLSEEETTENRSILDILAETSGQRVFKTANDVERYLQEERVGWDR